MKRTLSKPHIAYEQVGEQGPPVLLVMGLGMRGLVWAPQVERLARDHRLVYFDNRGIGESDPLEGLPTVRAFATDALRVADAAGFTQFHVVGVSLGGMIAQELTLAAPDRVRSLTLLATHAGGPLGMAPHPRGVLHFAQAFTLRGQARSNALGALLYTPEFLRSIDPALMAERRRMQQENAPPTSTTLRQLLAVARHDTRQRLRAIAVPTLVVKPERDLLVRPMHSDAIARAIPRARVHAIAQAGHGLIFENADEVSEQIRAHVRANEPQQS